MLQWLPRRALLVLIALVVIAALAGDLSPNGFSWTLSLGFSW